MEQLISEREAADRLNIKASSLEQLASRRHVRAYHPDGPRGPRYYSPVEIAEYGELRLRGLTLVEAAALAKSAYMTSLAVERQVQQVLELLGVNIPMLGRSEADVLALVADVDTLLDDEVVVPTTDLFMRWARVFFALSDEYFDLIAQHTGRDDPWGPFMRASAKLRALPVGQDLELQQAVRYLSVGHRVMQEAAYFHVRRTMGQRLASELFEDSSVDVNHRILAIMYDDRHRGDK